MWSTLRYIGRLIVFEDFFFVTTGNFSSKIVNDPQGRSVGVNPCKLEGIDNLGARLA